MRRLLILGAVMVVGCSGSKVDAPPNVMPQARNLPTTPLVESNSAFALDLYRQLGAVPGNLIFSPYSMSTALAMTYAGARGETASQMASVLHLTPADDSVHALSGALMAALLNPDRSYYERLKPHYERTHKKMPMCPVLRTANALWLQQDAPIVEAFAGNLRTNYGATAAPVDFERSADEAIRAINVWMAGQTNGLIKDIVSPRSIRHETRLVLTNALYWKAAWSTIFQKDRTKSEPFHVSLQKTMPVPMMSRQDYPCGLFQNAEVQCAELPYQWSDVAMLIILPRKMDGLVDIEQGLTPARLSDWIAHIENTEPNVFLPKFSIELGQDLKPQLAAMGMPLAFDQAKADFSGMIREHVWLDAALHKAVIQIDEEGTTAAAGAAMPMAAGIPPETIIFRADHPFLFLIRDTKTGTILFLGRFVSP